MKVIRVMSYAVAAVATTSVAIVLTTSAATVAHATGTPPADSLKCDLAAYKVTPGMTAAALNFWLTAHVHPTMPLLILSSQQVRDVSAYILSLRD